MLQYSIFQCFHNTNSQIGGAIYVNNPLYTIQFYSLGFADCTATNECGAFYLNGYQINLTNICGFMCRAVGHEYQLAKVECNELHDLNKFSSLTIAYCGINNQGLSAFGVCGQAYYTIVNINSSYNFNHNTNKSFGACFRTYNIKGYRVSYYDFSCSTGTDVINTHFWGTTVEYDGTFMLGNIYNCTSDFIFKYRGYNYMEHSFFGLLVYHIKSFECGSTNYPSHLLRISNCHFDRLPTDTPRCEITFSREENPFKTEFIGHMGIENCPIPTDRFTFSQYFTISSVFTESSFFSPSEIFTSSNSFTSSFSFTSSSKFTSSNKFSPSIEFTRSNSFSPSSEFSKSNSFSPSSEFTRSNLFSPSSEFSKSNSFSPSSEFTRSNSFSPSSEFSKSNSFSPSSKFTRSNSFSPSSEFTMSNSFSPSSEFTRSNPFSPSLAFIIEATSAFTASSPFTPSFTFSPNRTKYPDGRPNYERAQVSGRSLFDSPPSAAAVGATAGISVVIICVAVFFMLLYMRSKQKQLKGWVEDFSDDYLVDSTDSQDSSYSYSYYTYEYTYSSSNYEDDEEYTSDGYYYYPYYSYSYSDFDGNLMLGEKE